METADAERRETRKRKVLSGVMIWWRVDVVVMDGGGVTILFCCQRR